MRSGESAEHFVTLFDASFLPLGLCLHSSLVDWARPFHLWIVCMDEVVEKQLVELALPYVSLIPLREVESGDLLNVKTGRTLAEYCWTLTPFAPAFVFDRDHAVQRVTYVDADLFFFNPPGILLDELQEEAKDVLITEHAYAAEYDQSSEFGKYCVQFLTVCRTDAALNVMAWWQARCLEWCFRRVEEGRFGDQKYLDDWPKRFADEVHVVKQVERTLAPWNVGHFEKQDRVLRPVFFHFHLLRLVSPHKARLYVRYEVGPSGLTLYAHYLDSLKTNIRLMKSHGMQIRSQSLGESWHLLRTIKRRLTGVVEAHATLD